MSDDDVGPPELPEPASRRRVSAGDRPIAFVTVLGGGLAMLAVVAGIVILGVSDEGINEVATTGLTSIGATLAGGFAGWMGRTQPRAPDQPERKRSTDP